MLCLRATLAFLAAPTMVGGVIPWLLSRIDANEWFRTSLGWIPLAIGLAVLLTSVVSFYRRGRGTLLPVDPPKKLVVEDLYRFNRNPMYVGVTTILLGWALLTGNPWNYGYLLLVPMLFNLFIRIYEEPTMKRLFGEEWEAYRRAVPRWGIRLQSYSPTEKESD